MVPPQRTRSPRKPAPGKKRVTGGRRREQNGFPWPAALLAGLLLAVVCAFGLSHVLPGRRTAEAPAGDPVPPRGVEAPPQALTREEQTAVASALADLQEAPALPPREGSRPLMVIVIDDLGESMSAIRLLLSLDYPVTFAFWPHAGHVRQGAEAAHRAGREILIHYPMEPVGYPRVFPGPRSLLSSMPSERIAGLVEAGIAAVPHAVGLNNHMGSRFTQNRRGVSSVILTLKKHNLFLLDSVTHRRSVFADQARRLGIRAFRRDVFLDDTPGRSAVLSALRQAEGIALKRGSSIAIGHPLPETLAALQEWQKSRNSAVRLVRLQDLQDFDRQSLRALHRNLAFSGLLFQSQPPRAGDGGSQPASPKQFNNEIAL
ncbi:MAG: divergent polysaccharide deacetylase family protein [Desulfovibrio sp.]|jgi:polysaccharide deacetylase 2 family uncharacterized protein YibQ|nr:divergent polysaccharide deacetylase family protein [Desulfovibrio sp.]